MPDHNKNHQQAKGWFGVLLLALGGILAIPVAIFLMFVGFAVVMTAFALLLEL